MSTTIRLTAMPHATSFAPLGVVGYCLNRTGFLAAVWPELQLPLKVVHYSPEAKLLDIVASILSGCRAMSQVNTRLRPDVALAHAWGCARFADQSTLMRTLDAFTEAHVAQLRQGSEVLFRRESQAFQHDFGRDWLWLDIDLTPLPISKYAQSSTKGKFAIKNRYGRQLVRVQAPQYHETLFSRVYPGKQDSGPTYVPVLTALAKLGFTAAQRQRTLLRSDAGFGSDANVNQALAAGWQILSKGKGGRRPQAYAQQVAPDTWQAVAGERWLAPVGQAPCYVRPTQHWVLRWATERGEVKYSTLVCSILDWSPEQIMTYYDDRGACETEIQADKQGLKLERRRKKRLAAQEALILLSDIAHNLLAWIADWMFPSGPLAQFGITRLVEDVLSLPGQLFFSEQQLVEVQLNELHPHAAFVAEGLQRLLAHFGNP
jgi:hypothetical protein